MATSRDRARKLARAKLDRQQAKRAERARKRRRQQAAIGAALALLLVVAGALYFTGVFDGDPEGDTAAQSPCSWTSQDATTNDKLKDVGTPSTEGIAQAGTRPMTVSTNQGDPVTIDLDLATAPCAGASFAHLAGRNFYDNTVCHEVTADGAALHCGDPSGTGLGGPTYSFFDEDVPAAPDPAPSASAAPAPTAPLYPKGTVAMIGPTGSTNGSQFLIFLKDWTPPAGDAARYSIAGAVTGGQATLDKIAAIPLVDNGSGVKSKPKTDVTIQSLTVGAIATGVAPPSADPSADPSAAPSSAS